VRRPANDLRHRIAALLLMVGAGIAAASPAWAHASLVGSDPRDNAVVAEPPRQIVLTFQEPVQPAVLRLFDPNGSSTALTDVRTVGQTLVITPPQSLVRGTHALSWRVISADGHPIGGTVIFSIGAPGGTPLGGKATAATAVSAAIWLARVALFVGIFLGIGGALFQALLAEAPLPAAARTVIVGALGLALLVLPLSISLQGLDALARPLAEISRAEVWEAGFATSYGTSTSVVVLDLGYLVCSLFLDFG
jgi:copper transport protein